MLENLQQRVDDVAVTLSAIRRTPVVCRPRETDRPACGSDWEAMLPDQDLDDLALRGRPYSFRLRTSLIAVFSSARSAYIRLSLEFSASNSLIRLTSLPVAPAYLLRHW